MNYASRPQTFPCWCCPYIGGRCRLHQTANRWRRSTRAAPHLRNGRREQEWSLGGALGGEYRHRVCIVNLIILETDRDPEPIIRGRRSEHLDDFEIVSRVGKRPGKQAPNLAAELVGGHLRLRKANRAEQLLQLGHRQIARMRGVAQFFQSVELRGLC